MKCDWVQNNLLFYVYDELADDARYELEQHIGRCADCSAELNALRQFKGALAAHPVEDPAPNLLAASRMRLQEALETTRPGGWLQRLTFDPTAWLRQVRFSPALAAAILMAGFAGGAGTVYRFMPQRSVGLAGSAAPAPAESSITGIRSITQEPGTDQVNVRYDTVSTQEVKGSLNDQRVQQLLLFAARNNYSSGVRMDSVDLLTQKPDNDNVRQALIYSLQYDTNPGVRLKAIDGLGPYVKNDTQVRDAILQALVNDDNQGVRTEALKLLEPVQADSSVRSVLTRLAENDKNQYIRSQARTVIARLPEID
jgi:anti-sigma factor RsiW